MKALHINVACMGFGKGLKGQMSTGSSCFVCTQWKGQIRVIRPPMSSSLNINLFVCASILAQHHLHLAHELIDSCLFALSCLSTLSLHPVAA